MILYIISLQIGRMCIKFKRIIRSGTEREKIVITRESEMAKCFCYESEYLDREVFLDSGIKITDFHEISQF